MRPSTTITVHQDSRITTNQVESVCCSTPSSCYSDELIEQDDELHLIGDTQQNLLSPKLIFSLLLNLVFICLTASWLLHQGFALDLFGTVLLTLSAWTFAINCVLLGRIFVKIREESMLAGKTDDFRDYVRRVANMPSANLTADQRFTTKSNNNYLFLNGTQPVFV